LKAVIKGVVEVNRWRVGFWPWDSGGDMSLVSLGVVDPPQRCVIIADGDLNIHVLAAVKKTSLRHLRYLAQDE
jgi:hypothetical protein